MVHSRSPRAVLVLGASFWVLAACSAEQQEPAAPAQVSAPEHVKRRDPSNDDLTARVGHAILVDFKDGTTKAQFDAWEEEWGVDLEFNSEEEGPKDGVTVAVDVDDVDEVLAEIRQNPAVESAEPLLAYHSTFLPNDPDYKKQ